MIDWAALFLQLAVIGVGAASAFAWAKSANVKLPSIMETTWEGGGAYPAALAEQSLWNKRGATLAAVASTGQVIHLILTTVFPSP